MGNKGSKNRGSGSGSGSSGRNQARRASRTSRRRPTVSKGISFEDNSNNDSNSNGANGDAGKHLGDGEQRTPDSKEVLNQTDASLTSYSRVNADYAEIEPSAPKLEMRVLTPARENPWRSIRHKSARPKKKILGSLQVLLDDDARDSPWYCLAFDREDAMMLLQENAGRLSDGAFVITSSGLDFAKLTLLYKGNLVNVPIKNDEAGLYVCTTATGSQSKKRGRRCDSCACLSGLVELLSSGKPKYLPCLLQPEALDRDEYLQVMADVEVQPASADVTYDLGNDDTNHPASGPASPGYDIAQADRSVHGYDNLGVQSPPSVRYVEASEHNVSCDTIVEEPDTDVMMVVRGNHGYEDVGEKYHAPGYWDPNRGEDPEGVMTPPYATPERPLLGTPGDEGFIRISHVCINGQGEIKGITFQPCNDSQWFFVGLSNVLSNYHGDKDLHYNDIDFCIFCQGSGKATARECEDEVGPFISYKPGDTFAIRVRPETKHRNVVEYVHNDDVFYTSTRRPAFPLWVDQAFHPDSLGAQIIKSVKWTS